jgi:hypothetical protein
MTESISISQIVTRLSVRINEPSRSPADLQSEIYSCHAPKAV